jgi:phytanoyl-CoA hydroxylase
MYKEEIENFKRDGFCVFRQFFEPARIAAVEVNLQRYIDDVLPTYDGPGTMYEDVDDPNTLFRLEKMQQHDPFFRALLDDEQLAAIAADLLDDAVITHDVAMFAKAPLVGTGTPPHQDGYYLQLEPNNAVTFWLAIDRADNDNGCVRYAAGSPGDGLRPHAKTEAFGFSLGVADFGPADIAREQAVVVDPGDMIAHHSLAIHRTDDNRTNRLRRALGIIFVGAASTVNEEAVRAHAIETYAEWKETGRL